MTIKQQGGIFGRNPTFNEVEASDLTVRASVPTITIADTDTTGTHILKASNANLDISADPSGVQAGSGIRFFVDGDEKVKIDSNGNLIISNSGNGIDFSATSGTGTSELFDDYEEGTFNCAYSTTGTAFDSITMDATRTKGYYVKIGRVVHVQCTLRTDAVTVGSASGDLIITGLPFSTPANSSGTGDAYASFAVSLTGTFASDNPFVLATRPGYAHLLVRKRTSVTGGDVAMAPSDRDWETYCKTCIRITS